MAKKISKSQVKAIRTAASKLFGTCDCASTALGTGSLCDYHDWLAQNFDGIVSTLDLTFYQADEAIQALAKATGYETKRRRYSGSGKKGKAADWLTPKQANKIGILAALLDWEPKRVRGFLKRQTGRLCDVQMLRNYEAQKVITGMQKVIAGGDQDFYRILNSIEPFDPQTGLGKAVIKLFKNRLQERNREAHHGTATEEKRTSQR